MKIGDLVVRAYQWDRFEIGIIVDINHWVDKGAPDRNFGTDVIVLLEDGSQTPEAEYELDYLDHHIKDQEP